MQLFQGHCYGKRCASRKRSGDVYNDYLDILNGVVCDDSQIRWRLVHMATYAEYELWERHMQDGFHRCDTYEYLDNSTRVLLALRREDEEIARWWTIEMCEKGIIDVTWKDFNNFVCGCFMTPRRKVSCTKPVKAVQQSSRVAAVSIPSHAKEATAVVPVQTVSAAVTKFSEEKQPDVDKVVVCAEAAVDTVEPLSGLNMQLKRVHDEICKKVDKGQRWSLF
jgi:hypothetical protein